MKTEFIPYDEALALKELGFDEPCFRFYSERYTIDSKTGGDIKMGEFYLTDTPRQKTIRCSAPLYQQAFRWFREKYNLYSEITLDSYKEPYSLKVTIKHLDSTNTFVNKEYLPYSNGIGDIDNKNYEEAELACLDKLIEIVKNK